MSGDSRRRESNSSRSGRLSKQAGVEDEDSPRNDIAKMSADGLQRLNGPNYSNQTSPPLKSKLLIRSHALCGDDDNKLKSSMVEKQCNSTSKCGSATSSLSRDSNNEVFTDSTGINLEDFILTTLHKNAKDRHMLLQLEDELRDFVQDTMKQAHKFPPMSSYNRMLVHRISAFFGLDHNVDQTGTAVVVNKTVQTRLPQANFAQYICTDHYTDESRRYLRRDVQSYEEVQGNAGLLEYRKTQSLDVVCEGRPDWPTQPSGFFPVEMSGLNRGDILFAPTNDTVESPLSAYSSMDTCTGSARPWSSTDSSTRPARTRTTFNRIRRGDSHKTDSVTSPMSSRQPSIPEGVMFDAVQRPQSVMLTVGNTDQLVVDPHTVPPTINLPLHVSGPLMSGGTSDEPSYGHTNYCASRPYPGDQAVPYGTTVFSEQTSADIA